MKSKIIIYLSFLLIVSAFIASEVFAQCPEGKQPVDVTTPSGIGKTLCIPPEAVQRIETAEEHSGGTIVASECPCWTSQDLNRVDTTYPDLACFAKDGSFRCFKNYSGSVIFLNDLSFQLKAGAYCENLISDQYVSPITPEEQDACAALAEQYIIILPSK